MKPAARPLTPEELARMSTDTKLAKNIREWAAKTLANRQPPPPAPEPEPEPLPENPSPATIEAKITEAKDLWAGKGFVFTGLGRCNDCLYPFQKRKERLPMHAEGTIIQVCQSCYTVRWRAIHLTKSND